MCEDVLTNRISTNEDSLACASSILMSASVTTMDNQPKSETRITLGICVKNSGKTLQKCLESILNQKYPRELMEIIVVDGGSTDDTMDIATSIISKSGVPSRFCSDQGKGLGSARQIVLDITDNEYVVWVDSDVIVSSDFLVNEVKFMRQNPRVAVATGKYILKKNHLDTLPAILEGISKYVASIEYPLARKQPGLPPNDASIYRVKAAKQVQGFDKNIRGASEDTDLIVRMRKKGWLLSVNEKAGYCAFSRETWQGMWTERSWFGYGTHYLGHKHRDMHVCRRAVPFVVLLAGLRMSIEAYRLTLRKESFLLPLASVFLNTAWWFGYVKGHMDGYGHKLVNNIRTEL